MFFSNIINTNARLSHVTNTTCRLVDVKTSLTPSCENELSVATDGCNLHTMLAVPPSL